MIKVCTKDIFKIELNSFNKNNLINFCERYGRKIDIKFLIYNGSKILKVITYLDLIHDRKVDSITFIHNKNIFIDTRDYFYENSKPEGSCVAVTNSDGEFKYILQYYSNEYYKKGHMAFSNSKFDKYTMDNSCVDLTLLKRADSYIFMRVEEYSYKITSIILELMPEKKIYFMDKSVEYFFNSKKVKYIENFYEVLQEQNNFNCMVINSTISTVETILPQYIEKYYNSIEIMTSLYWINDVMIESFGNKNPNKTFFVIDCATNISGIVDIMKYTLIYCVFAESRGWIPIVNLNKFPNQYLQKSGENMWKYYFKQFYNYSLSEVYSSRNVISASESNIIFGPFYNPYLKEIESNIYSQAGKVNNWFADRINWREDIVQYCNCQMPKEFNENKRILGVIARGTDYNKEAVKYRYGTDKIHNTDVDSLINLVKDELNKSNYDYIYLATEDLENYTKFKEEFGDMLIATQQKRVKFDKDLETSKKYVWELINKDNDYEFGKKYLSVIWCLSKCNKLISSAYCGAKLAAESLNKGCYDKNRI